MAPFEPKAERARWVIAYDLLAAEPQGSVLTYERLGDALDVDATAQRHVIQQAVSRALRELETVHRRTAVAVPNEGYRMAGPMEQYSVGRSRKRRSDVALRRSNDVVSTIDMSGIPEDMRPGVLALGRMVAAQMDFNRRTEQRLSRHEDLFAELDGRLTALEQPAE